MLYVRDFFYVLCVSELRVNWNVGAVLMMLITFYSFERFGEMIVPTVLMNKLIFLFF